MCLSQMVREYWWEEEGLGTQTGACREQAPCLSRLKRCEKARTIEKHYPKFQTLRNHEKIYLSSSPAGSLYRKEKLNSQIISGLYLQCCQSNTMVSFYNWSKTAMTQLFEYFGQHKCSWLIATGSCKNTIFSGHNSEVIFVGFFSNNWV